MSPHPGWVNSSSLVSFCRNCFMCCSIILEIVSITQAGLSSLLSLSSSAHSSSSSSSSSQSSSVLELVRSNWLFLIALFFSSNIFSGFLVVHYTLSAFLISSGCCIIAVCAFSTRLLATEVSLSTSFLIHCSVFSLLKKCVSWPFSADSFFLDGKLRHAPKAPTLIASNLPIPSLTWRRGYVDRIADLPYLPTTCTEKISLGMLTIVCWVDFVVGWDVGYCKIRTMRTQAASFMSRVVCLIILNKIQSAFWPSLLWE